MEHFELIGGSATDFRPVFRHVDQLLAEGAFTHLRGLLYFTDGMGHLPKKAPALRRGLRAAGGAAQRR
jgi:predicted metal-dependent peptidase